MTIFNHAGRQTWGRRFGRRRLFESERGTPSSLDDKDLVRQYASAFEAGSHVDHNTREALYREIEKRGLCPYDARAGKVSPGGKRRTSSISSMNDRELVRRYAESFRKGSGVSPLTRRWLAREIERRGLCPYDAKEGKVTAAAPQTASPESGGGPGSVREAVDWVLGGTSIEEAVDNVVFERTRGILRAGIGHGW